MVPSCPRAGTTIYALIAFCSLATRSGGGLLIPWDDLAWAAAIAMISFASLEPFTSNPQFIPISAHLKLAMVDLGRGMDDWSIYLFIPRIFASKLTRGEILVNEPVSRAGELCSRCEPLRASV